MPPGSVALNGMQRRVRQPLDYWALENLAPVHWVTVALSFCFQAARVSTGDVVLADPFLPPRAGFEIQGLQAELGTLTKRRPGGPQEELDGRELEAHVLRRFSGQVTLLRHEGTVEGAASVPQPGWQWGQSICSGDDVSFMMRRQRHSATQSATDPAEGPMICCQLSTCHACAGAGAGPDADAGVPGDDVHAEGAAHAGRRRRRRVAGARAGAADGRDAGHLQRRLRCPSFANQ